jgi:hypothetical protein
MTKRIVWQLPDGSKRYTTPAAPMLEGETEEAYLNRVAMRTRSVLADLKDAVRIADISAEEHAAIRLARSDAS